MAGWASLWRRSAGAAPWYFLLPAVLVVAALLLALTYLGWRAFEGGWSGFWEVFWRPRTLTLFLNTLKLTGGVLVLTTLLAFPLAWLTTRTSLARSRVVIVLGVLPLAIPGYIMAWALLSLGGDYGIVTRLSGWDFPRFRGYAGALLAIGLYAFPYLYLNLRAALLGMDPAQEDAARSLGYTPWQVFFFVIVPQCRPAYLAGCLIIVLYVLGDFGTVTLMNYPTFSQAIFVQYTSLMDARTASSLALLLILLTAILLWFEVRLVGRAELFKIGSGTKRPAILYPVGWKWLIVGPFLVLLGVVTLVAPIGVMIFWLVEYWPEGEMIRVWGGLRDSFSVAVPAALLAGAGALPIAYLGVRFPSRVSRILERMAYFGYALPPLALALAAAFLGLTLLPWLDQTLLLLVLVCALYFLAECIGPVRSSLLQASPRIEEAARSLGCNAFAAFWLATFPLLGKGLLAGVAFVFLSVMKELPITFILSPWGFSPLAVNIWDRSNEALYAEAAPHALALLIFSFLFVGLLMVRERRLH